MTDVATRPYSTELSKGQGAITETLTLLEHWQPGEHRQALAQRIRDQGILGRATANRVDDLVQRVFVRRYLVEEDRPAVYLKRLLAGQADPALIRQLMLIYTARQHPILRDFLGLVYWPRYHDGARLLARADAEAFIKEAQADGRIATAWSASMQERVARNLVGTLGDFGLVENTRQTVRHLLPYRLLPTTALYLAHEIHFRGVGDNSIPVDPDWALFGLTREAVVEMLERVSRGGHFIVQYSGELLRIAWRYRTMEECLDGLAGQ